MSGQPLEMLPHLRIAPAALVKQLTAAKAEAALLDLLLLTLGRHPAVHHLEQPARLRRQLVQRPAEGLRGQAVRHGDVIERRLDVVDSPATDHAGLHLALVLVDQRHRVDERQVFFMVSSGPGGVVEEGEPVGERVHDMEGLQQPLGVLVELEQLLPAPAGARGRRASGPRAAARGSPASAPGSRRPRARCSG